MVGIVDRYPPNDQPRAQDIVPYLLATRPATGAVQVDSGMPVVYLKQTGSLNLGDVFVVKGPCKVGMIDRRDSASLPDFVHISLQGRHHIGGFDGLWISIYTDGSQVNSFGFIEDP